MVLEYHHFSALKDEWIETSISNGCHYHKKEKQLYIYIYIYIHLLIRGHNIGTQIPLQNNSMKK